MQTRQITVEGHVQGVGFRPFVYRLARDHGLAGWVQNRVGQVRMLVQGRPASIAAFRADLSARAPRLARFRVTGDEAAVARAFTDFTILASDHTSEARIFVPPDRNACPECLTELNDPSDRRYRYPFVNCTNCGPRYTLIHALPYDRANTSMAGFTLCPACRNEYEDPLDRRFHAEPVACPDCGPTLTYRQSPKTDVRGDAAIEDAVNDLRAGSILALKGIGGYQLICDAYNDAAVKRLRACKDRPDKPLAVMFPVKGPDGLDALRKEVTLSAGIEERILSTMRPIVLATRREGCGLPESIAPGLTEIGVFLPCNPLQQLLTSGLGRAIVATSGNLSGEPMLTDEHAVENRLGHIVDGYLHHDRDIVRPADDPVFREICGQTRPLRLGRGCAPVELPLPYPIDEPILALGGHLKNTIALAWEDRIVVSPHLGEMDTPRSLRVFERTVRDLQSLYNVDARILVCDAHPGYSTTRWAERSGLQTRKVLHHFAHASALAGECGIDNRMLVFTWDGAGFGEDGTLWGGEALLGLPGEWRRVGSIEPFRLPGGDRAAREPWRCAASICWETGRHWDRASRDSSLLRQAWHRGINAPYTSAMGRLFDAAAALVLDIDTVSYEGQAPMMLEAAANESRVHLDLPLRTDSEGVIRMDWTPLLSPLLDDDRSRPERAALFHETLARGITAQAELFRKQYGVTEVGLTGGVFQNARLTQSARRLLEDAGFGVHLSEKIPCNDAGLSFGQAIETAARLTR